MSGAVKTEYEFIRFEKVSGEWTCINKKSGFELGWIEYYSRWRQYVITTFAHDAIFNDQCLKDIAEFLCALNIDKKGTRAKSRKPGDERRKLEMHGINYH
jgi:hypothetical protein